MKTRQAGKSHSHIPANSFITLVACSLFLYSCHSNTQQQNTATNSVVKPAAIRPHSVSIIELLVGNGKNAFRNVSFGDNPKTVQNSEKKAADEIDTNYVSYTLPLDTLNADSVNEEIDSLNYFSIAYNFDQQKLNEIDEDIFLATDSVAAGVAQRFTDYFTNKYGEAATGSDEQVWSFTSKGKKVKVTLSDQSAEYDYGKLSLVFYCEDY